MFNLTPVIKNLLLTNVVVFSLAILFRLFNIELFQYFALFDPKSQYFQYWQFITHQFLHSGPLHLLFNMLALASLGPFVETYFGGKKFLTFYLVSGVIAALLYILTSNINSTNVDIPMVGASGALFGVLAFFAIIHPNEKLYLFLIPIGIKAKWAIGVLIAIELGLSLHSDPNDHVAHMAHIGGALSGLLFYLPIIYKKIYNK